MGLYPMVLHYHYLAGGAGGTGSGAGAGAGGGAGCSAGLGHPAVKVNAAKSIRESIIDVSFFNLFHLLSHFLIYIVSIIYI